MRKLGYKSLLLLEQRPVRVLISAIPHDGVVTASMYQPTQTECVRVVGNNYSGDSHLRAGTSRDACRVAGDRAVADRQIGCPGAGSDPGSVVIGKHAASNLALRARPGA